MRVGELIATGFLAVLSLYLMWKSTELPIGFIPDKGPGGGAWPFWLSGIMLMSCVWSAVNSLRGRTPASQSEEPVLDSYGWRTLIFVGGGIVVFVALIGIVSMYGAIAIFLFYYTWFLGRHGLPLSLTISLVTPIALFFFFEGAMQITMPTGLPFTDPVFNVLYDIIY